jgi:zinc transport system substrate-binding protein
MKKIFIVLPALLATLLLSACQTKTYDIVVTLYPQYDMVRAIVGDQDLTYTMILPPGVEAHDFEPTSKQVIQINQAKLFIYTSIELETWALDILDSDVIAVDLEALTEEIHDAAHPGETHDEDDHDHDHEHDVHYWVSVHTQVHMVEAVLQSIIQIDPDNEAIYTANAEVLKNQLKAIHTAFLTIENPSSRPIYFIGHNVFSALNEEFDLNIISLTESFSPDADPTSAQIAQMIQAIRESGVNYVYYDPFESMSVANTIKNDLKTAYNYDIVLMPLHSMHNVSKDQFKAKTTLIELWTENLNNIKLNYADGVL